MGEGQNGESGSHTKEAAENECLRKSQDGCRCKEALGQRVVSNEFQMDTFLVVSGMERRCVEYGTWREWEELPAY